MIQDTVKVRSEHEKIVKSDNALVIDTLLKSLHLSNKDKFRMPFGSLETSSYLFQGCFYFTWFFTEIFASNRICSYRSGES